MNENRNQTQQTPAVRAREDWQRPELRRVDARTAEGTPTSTTDSVVLS
jgi:hypothetical protein